MPENKEQKQKTYEMFIKTRLLSVLVTAVTPMILVSGIILYQFYTSYREKVHAHLETLVKKHKQNIDTFLNEKLANIRFLAENVSFDELSADSSLRDRLESLQHEYGTIFVDLGVINEKGTQIAYAGPFKLKKAQYKDMEWFKKAMNSEHFISDVFLGLRDLPHFIVTVKKNHRGKPWILRATIDFVAFNNLVENIRIGETGFAFILNREGKLQTRPLFDIVPGGPPYSDYLKMKDRGKIYIAEKSEDFLNTIIYVAAFLKGGDWLLIYQQRASDAFSSFRRALKAALVIILLGSIASLSMAFVRFKKMSFNISRAEKEKQLMNEQIVETGKLASVGELAAGIAHEINNPVAIMVEEAGWIEDLLEEEEFREGENLNEFRRALKQIGTQGRRCKDITHKLLSFARKTDSRIHDVDLNDVIEEIIALSSQRAKYANVNIHKNLQKDLPRIKVSQTEMQQVLLNLVNNALDAMEKKGGNVELFSKLEGDEILIEVVDTGPGIPESNLNRIFDPFFTTKPVGKGTGLGLSICYGIITKLGGEIIVHSTLDVGTAFRVKLPLKRDENKS
ncbi:MAG: cache domain-containing protein [Pseudomonadota bacterium]